MAPARPRPQTSPAVLRQELADRLRELRLRAGMTIDDVAAQLLVSASKISRIETASRPASLRDVRDLAGLYAVTPDELDSLMSLTQNSRRTSVWQQYGSAFSEHADLEDAATSVAHYQTSLIPGLLQIEDYGHAITAGFRPNLAPEEQQRLTRARLARQDALLGRGSPRLDYVLDEAALLRQVGGAGVLRRQLIALVEHSRLPAVTIRIIPMTAGAHPGMDSAFEIFSFPGVSGVVYLENLAGDFFLRRASDLDRYGAAFRRLADSALDVAASRRLIEDRAAVLPDE